MCTDARIGKRDIVELEICLTVYFFLCKNEFITKPNFVIIIIERNKQQIIRPAYRCDISLIRLSFPSKILSL